MDGLPFDFALDPSQLSCSIDSTAKSDISFDRDLDDDDEVSFVSKWRETAAPVSNARISGLDEVFGGFQEPLTDTQRLISGAPLSPIANDVTTKVEIADEVIEIRDNSTQDAVPSRDCSKCNELLEVTKTETIEIKTTKTYFVGGKKFGERVKSRTVESSNTLLRLSQSELDKKTRQTRRECRIQERT